MQHVNGVPVYSDDPTLYYNGLDNEPTWFSAQGGVYRCKTRHAPYTEVAIKKYLVEETDLYPDLFVMPKELVENEIYTMTKCVHDNILKLKGVYLHQEFVYLIMPYCTGGSLQQYVFDHHLTINQLVHIITSIASGLAQIHRHGYIHRDIKCDNIFLMQETNEIVIGDFGVVSISPAADSNVEEAGVVLFWSPELVQRKIVNRKVDIWALGIVILEILNGGKAPYEDDRLDEEEIKQRILENGKPAFPSDIPSRLVDLLDLCLNPDPKYRGSADDVLQHPFLCDYEPEPLFPGNRLDKQDATDDMSIDDDNNNNDEAMETALNKLRALESLHGMDIGLDHEQHVTTTTATDNQTSKLVEAATTASDTMDHQPSPRSPSLSPPGSNETSTSSLDTNRTNATTSSTDQKENQPTVVATTSTIGGKRIPATISDIRRCRLPLRAFKLTEENANVNNTTTKERVLSVVKKRQSISEIHWAQGSKLPVFKAQPPSILEDIKEKKIKRVKSVRLPKEQAKENNNNNKSVRRPLVRANTMPASQSSNLLLKKQQKPASVPKKMGSQQNNKPTSPVSSSKAMTRPKVMFNPPSTKEPPKKKISLYRRKCLPGESRTARLMMGISTTGRVRSPRETSPTENMPPTTCSNSRSFLRDSIKKRPVSFADKQPDPKKIHPEATQTTPLPMATKSKRFPFGKKPSSSTNKGPQQPTKSTAATNSFKGMKVVHVH
ncbi:kinase-like protein [Lichtheimia hyalospora FSU 10163]|nr:kinase-like protein [Lichtheimia hyalospora FSU 10163]